MVYVDCLASIALAYGQYLQANFSNRASVRHEYNAYCAAIRSLI